MNTYHNNLSILADPTLSSVIAIETHANGLDFIDIKTSQCEASICLQGGHLVNFKPLHDDEIIWLSNAVDFKPGVPIRGGVPVCWPWFGPHATNNNLPAHGFARTAFWKLDDAYFEQDALLIRLSLPAAQYPNYWPTSHRVYLEFRLSSWLQIKLINVNDGGDEVSVSQALHSYLSVDDIAQTSVKGLVDSHYLDKLNPDAGLQMQGDDLRVSQEVDRIYQTGGPFTIVQANSANIEVTSENSNSAVVWNPWVEKSQSLSNFFDTDYLQMLCVETANVMDDALTLKPGESHELVMTAYRQPEDG